METEHQTRQQGKPSRAKLARLAVLLTSLASLARLRCLHRRASFSPLALPVHQEPQPQTATQAAPRRYGGIVIPLLHDFTGSTVLIFGGGPVGARKARRFAREARVVVVSPAFADADFGSVERIRAAPTSDDIPVWFEWTGPVLVVAATNDETVNDAVARTAHERGVLLNRADRSNGSDESDAEAVRNVVVPATVRDDPVLLAVATGGRSPALSRYLRERFEEEFANAGAMATLSGKLREQLREEVPAEKRRAAIRRVVRSERVWKALGDGSLNAEQEAKSVLHDVLSEGEP